MTVREFLTKKLVSGSPADVRLASQALALMGSPRRMHETAGRLGRVRRLKDSTPLHESASRRAPDLRNAKAVADFLREGAHQDSMRMAAMGGPPTQPAGIAF